VWQERPKGISHDCNRWLSSQATWLPDGVFIFYFYFFYPSVLSLSLLHIQKEPLTLFSTWTQPPTPQHLNSPRSDEARKMGQADKRLTTFPSFFSSSVVSFAQESRHIRILCNLSGAIHF
jgi:hypothetical protein